MEDRAAVGIDEGNEAGGCKMKAYISAFKDKSRIELVDDNGFHLDTIEVDDIHVEIGRENIELVARIHKPTLRAGCFYAN